MPNGTPAVSVGRFSYDRPSSTISGPAEYMKDRQAFLSALSSGNLTTGQRACLAAAPVGSDPAVLLLVLVQTDYAAWLGMRQFEGSRSEAVRRSR